LPWGLCRLIQDLQKKRKALNKVPALPHRNSFRPALPDTAITRRWTPDEDADLTSAVVNTSKKKLDIEYISDWNAAAVVVQGRTERAKIWCLSTPEEDSKLKDAVQTRGDKDWGAIAALGLGRTRCQCWHRWYDVLDPSIIRANKREASG
jgi:hypothetical protein